MIIVSGPDNSGKTTLVKKLVNDLGLNNVEKCKHQPLWDHHRQYTDWVCKTLQGGPKDIVDRCLIDEYVYGPIMRGKICFDPLDIYNIEMALKNKNILFIITNPGVEAISRTYSAREQYPHLTQNLRVLDRFYYTLLKDPFNKFPHYIFNYQFDPDYELVGRVVLNHMSKEDNKDEHL